MGVALVTQDIVNASKEGNSVLATEGTPNSSSFSYKGEWANA